MIKYFVIMFFKTKLHYVNGDLRDSVAILTKGSRDSLDPSKKRVDSYF
jgi:hypothetical protein